MSELTTLFRKRIGISENEKISFESLDFILEKTAKSIPFENFCIIKKETKDITRDNLINKILVNNEGGLCYELNTILYYFLIENGLQARLTSGVVYNHDSGDYYTFGRTHATILLNHENQTYLVDTGFGANLPLKPVPLDGSTITSKNGEFRIKKEQTTHGDYVLQTKLKHKDTDWKIGYAFDSKLTIQIESELNEIQTIIAEHQNSPFNKNPLITQITNEGNVTLTNTSFTRWVDGKVTKEEVDNEKFNKLVREHFGRNIK